VVKHLLQIHAFSSINNQTLSDEVLGIRTNSEAGTFSRELVSSGLYLFVSIFYFLRLERRSTTEHRIEDDSDGPIVYFETVASITRLKDLWSKVVWSSTDRLFAFSSVENLGCQTEIANLDCHLGVQK
jgi:hypothetical protein